MTGSNTVKGQDYHWSVQNSIHWASVNKPEVKMQNPPGLLLPTWATSSLSQQLLFQVSHRHRTPFWRRKKVLCLIGFKVQMELTHMTQKSFTRFKESKGQLKLFWHPHLWTASPASNYQDPKYLSQIASILKNVNLKGEFWYMHRYWIYVCICSMVQALQKIS